jgi:hypothetical protein
MQAREGFSEAVFIRLVTGWLRWVLRNGWRVACGRDAGGCKVWSMQYFFSPRFTPSFRYWRPVAASVA